MVASETDAKNIKKLETAAPSDKSHAAADVSRQALNPGDPHAAKAGLDQKKTDKVPHAEVGKDGSLTFNHDSPARGKVSHDKASHKLEVSRDQQGNVNKIVQPDGSTYTRQNGKWLDAKGNDQGLSEIRVLNDGKLSYRKGDDIAIESSDGKTAHFSLKIAQKAAQDLHEANNHSDWFGMHSAPDKDKILNTLEPMSDAQRQIIAEQYKIQFKSDLSKDVSDKAGHVEGARVEALLNRRDGVADNSGQIHEALAKLQECGPYERSRGAAGMSDDRIRAEKEVRDSINSLTTDQVHSVESKYKQDYGRDLKADLLTNSQISDASKEALKIQLNGSEHRTDADTLKLADDALSAKRPDLFSEAFRDASQTARDKFKKDGGEKRIDSSFDAADRAVAKDYAERGSVSVATIVSGDSHWYHTNRDDIERAVSKASPQDRKDFIRGEQLTQSGSKANLSSDDARALDYYKKVDAALHASGNTREATLWAAKLRNQDDVLTNVLSSHSDGYFGIGGSTDKNQELSAVEKISQKDWQYLKGNPDEVKKIEQALGSFGDSHKDQVLKMLHDKLAANTFDASKTVGNRALADRLGDNASYADAGLRVDAMLSMTADERHNYASNAGGYRDKINTLLKSDEERFLASNLAKSSDNRPSPVDKVLIDDLKNDNPVGTMQDVQSALRDSALKDRILNPRNEEDKKVSQWFHSAVDGAVDKAGLGAKSYGEGGYYPGEYEQYQKQVFKDGRVPLDSMLQLSQDKDQKIDLILHASPEEKAHLLNTRPDAQTKNFQDSVFGQNEDFKQIMRNGLQQKDAAGNPGNLDQADKFRLFAIGSSSADASGLQDQLQKMPPADRQKLADEYFSKYQKLISEDVIDKVGSADKWRFRELLSPTDAGARQTALDAQMSNDNHASGWDQFLKNNWDYSRVSADSTQDNINKFVKEHGAEIDKLPADQKKQFEDALSNFQKAQKDYIDSKGEFADKFVDATITVAAFGGAAFTGGTSLALLSAVGVGAGVAGAAYRVGMMHSIEGSDFDSSQANTLKQGFNGFSSAASMFLAPEMLGVKGLSVGVEVAGLSATKLLAEQGSKSLFKEGSEALLKEGLSGVSRQSAITGSADIAKLAEKVAANGADKAAVEQAIKQELKQEVMSGVKNKFVNEVNDYVRNMGVAQIGNASTQVLSTAAGFEDPNTLWQRLGQSSMATAAGATFFHVGFRAATAGYHGTQALLGHDQNGVFMGPGTKYERNGEQHVVANDDKVYAKSGDKLIEQDHSKELASPADGAANRKGGDGVWGNADSSTAPKATYKFNGHEIQPNTVYDIAPGEKLCIDTNGRRLIATDGQQKVLVNGREIAKGNWHEFTAHDVVTSNGHTVRTETSLTPTYEFNFQGQKFSTRPGQEVQIGRGDLDAQNKIISGNHANLGMDTKGLYIVDHSTNGTWVNGQRIRPDEKTYLKATDEVWLGGSQRRHGEGEYLSLLPSDAMKYDSSFRPRDARAVDQSNHFAQAQELRGKLRDGYEDGGKFSHYDADGKMTTPARREIITVDRKNDPVLRDTIAQAKKMTAGMNDAQKAAWLNSYVRDLMNPKQMSGAALDAWNDAFSSSHAGQKIPLGEYIRQGRGVCIHQATLMKVLGDEVGLDITLVRGTGQEGNPAMNHAWAEVNLPGQREPLIYDPRWDKAGVRRADIPAHDRGSEVLSRQGQNLPPEPHLYSDAAPQVRAGGEINGQSFPPEQPVLIGSTQDASLQMGFRGDGVSAKHAYIFTDDSGQTWIADANSSYGTFLIDAGGNRVQLAKPASDGRLQWNKVNKGDKVGLGPHFVTAVG